MNQKRNFILCKKESHKNQIHYYICLDEYCRSNLKTFCCFCSEEDHIDNHRWLTLDKFVLEFSQLYKKYQQEDLEHCYIFDYTLNQIELALMKTSFQDRYSIKLKEIKKVWRQMQDPFYDEVQKFLATYNQPNMKVPDVQTLTNLIVSVKPQDIYHFDIRKPIRSFVNFTRIEELAQDILKGLAAEILENELQNKIEVFCSGILKIISRQTEK